MADVDLDVDHVRPLTMGGADTDGNVQVLCRGCHQLKTSTEFGAGLGGLRIPFLGSGLACHQMCSVDGDCTETEGSCPIDDG